MAVIVDSEIRAIVRQGLVIPAHPLALTSERRLDERRQTALTAYYCEAGAGGIAVGVHTTQFSIRNPKIGLYEPVLKLAIAKARAFERQNSKRVVKVAGICGPTKQACDEARFAHSEGYDLGLISLSALAQAKDQELIAHCRAVSEEIPLFGFYLQASVGGRPLSYEFWRAFCDLESVVAIKVAPFNRYQTLDVVRALADSGRGDEITLYTGNDDNIIPDLLTDYRLGKTTLCFAGGLLGQWAVWTQRAVKLLEMIQECRHDGGKSTTMDVLAGSAALTDANAVLFDAKNKFAGCIAGLHEILRRQGLLAGRWCLDPEEDLSPGQLEEIDRITTAYPELMDDDFVRSNLDRWLQ